MTFLTQRWLAITTMAALLVGCSALHDKQGEWIFAPRPGSWGNSAQLASTMQDVWIEFDSTVTRSRVRMHGMWAAHPSSEAPVLLYLHGARWNVTGSSQRVLRMRDLGFNVLVIDYRGFGQTSTETPSEAMAYEDARAAWAWMAQKYPQRDRYVFGHSLGGAIAIDLAASVSDERGTIVEGTFTSIPDVVKFYPWGWLPVTGLVTQRFDAASKVASIGSPLLVVHGASDRTIDPSLGRKLFDAAVEPKRFIEVEGGSHHNTNAIGHEAYRDALKTLFGHNGRD